MSTRSKLSCLSWNKYIKAHIASSDYEGIITVWDVNQRQVCRLGLPMRKHLQVVWRWSTKWFMDDLFVRCLFEWLYSPCGFCVVCLGLFPIGPSNIFICNNGDLHYIWPNTVCRALWSMRNMKSGLGVWISQEQIQLCWSQGVMMARCVLFFFLLMSQSSSINCDNYLVSLWWWTLQSRAEGVSWAI